MVEFGKEKMSNLAEKKYGFGQPIPVEIEGIEPGDTVRITRGRGKGIETEVLRIDGSILRDEYLFVIDTENADFYKGSDRRIFKNKVELVDKIRECDECGSRKAHHDRRETWFCPFCDM